MQYFPFFFNLKNVSVLIVGGGEIALRKYQLLKRADANITLVAPEFLPELYRLALDNSDELVTGWYNPSLLTNRRFVISATNDEALNRRVHADCQSLNIPINVVDQPDLCDFIFPALVDRSPLVIAISSSGVSPVLARLLRAKIEALIPPTFGKLVQLAQKYRDAIRGKFQQIEFRRAFYEDFLQGKVAHLLFSGQEKQAEQALQIQLSDADVSYFKGEAYIVGAGPGDPDLLTFKALRLMQQSDVVLYDRLVSAEILDLCRRDAEKIHVGKEKGFHSKPQDEINALLVQFAQEGKRVLRLKGGDPFIFGRGGEEVLALQAAGIPYQIVPAVTSAIGAAAYAGIPLTHRNMAQSVQFSAIHAGNLGNDTFWKNAISYPQTLVFYMGMHVLPDIVSRLLEAGASADLPIAIVSQATTQQQKVVTGTLENIVAVTQKTSLPSPTLIIIGEVVHLHETLAWFGNTPQPESVFEILKPISDDSQAR
jgi:uroporphyrin-III C-methyltransferase/precorrin-2 dehydrogenase/sirohydrochlorin ferrochelatase